MCIRDSPSPAPLAASLCLPRASPSTLTRPNPCAVRLLPSRAVARPLDPARERHGGARAQLRRRARRVDQVPPHLRPGDALRRRGVRQRPRDALGSRQDQPRARRRDRGRHLRLPGRAAPVHGDRGQPVLGVRPRGQPSHRGEHPAGEARAARQRPLGVLRRVPREDGQQWPLLRRALVAQAGYDARSAAVAQSGRHLWGFGRCHCGARHSRDDERGHAGHRGRQAHRRHAAPAPAQARGRHGRRDALIEPALRCTARPTTLLRPPEAASRAPCPLPRVAPATLTR
eukprot:3457921-Prymnesium_polylepis.1